MVRIEELRVGNYVKYHTQLVKISKIDGGKALTNMKIDQSYEVNLSDVLPIAINENTLDQLGFRKKEGNIFEKDYFSLLPHIGGTYDIKFKSTELGNIKWVHELQNKYERYVGQRLTIGVR